MIEDEFLANIDRVAHRSDDPAAVPEFNALVADFEQTCYSCPTQYEGHLADGREFYFRYRWGYATVRVAKDADRGPFHPDADVTSVQIGGDNDGTLSEVEFKHQMVAGLAKIAAETRNP